MPEAAAWEDGAIPAAAAEGAADGARELPIMRQPWFFPAALAASLLLSACSLPALVRSATPTSPPIPTASAIPSPTPEPHILLLSASDGSPLEEALRAWASGRGWALHVAPAVRVNLAGLLRAPGLQAVVAAEDTADAEALASSTPGLPWVVVDGATVVPGTRTSIVGGLGTRHDQAAFLAGVLTGLVSRTRSVGLIGETGGGDEAVYGSAFLHGLRYGCGVCGLLVISAIPEASATLEGFGADVVFVIPGPEAEAAQGLLADAGLWVVWAGETPVSIPADRLAGGVAFAPEGIVPQAVEALLAGEAGRIWSYAVGNRGIQLVGLEPEAISPGRQRVLEAAYQALASGELDIGVDPVTGEER